MSTLATNVLTLADWAKRLDPDGKVPAIVELLAQTNEVLNDMQWKEGNLPTGERTTQRTSLPTAAWRLLNTGVTPSKSTTAQVDEATGILEAWSEVDKDLAMLNGNTQAFRLSEAQAFIEAMNQTMVSTMFYGNQGLTPEQFTGLAPRYNLSTGSNGQNILLGGGASGQTDESSIWLVVWGASSIFGIFPKGSKAGLIHEDLGECTIETTAGIAGTRMQGYRDHFQWKCGIAVKDWRYVVRIANLDFSDNNANFVTLMIRAMYKVPSLNAGRAVFYMNRTIAARLDLLRFTNQQAGAGFTWENPDGKQLFSFRKIPIRIVDQLLTTESAIS